MTFTIDQEKEMVRLYGHPDRLTTIQEMTPEGMNIVRSSMKNGRAHDITLYIGKDGGYIFIAKPSYPEGLFRAPSGGILPGEDFEAGSKREALEETGLSIELDRYILRIDVRFQCHKDYIDWTSHVFTARHIDGEISPKDKGEISEARVVGREELPGLIDLMANSGIGGLIYRAYLTRETEKRL